MRIVPTGDAALTMHSLGASTRILVASPQLASRLRDLDHLASFATLATADQGEFAEWFLETDDGRTQMLRHEPRMGCGDFGAVRDAAVAGLGVALLPDHLCRHALESGDLVRVLPEWRGRRGVVHLVFTTRQGLPPAVRALIDHLAAGFSKRTSESRFA